MSQTHNEQIHLFKQQQTLNDPDKEIELAEEEALTVSKAADFEHAISETGYGKFNYLLLLLAFPAACSNIYDSSALSYALPTATCDLKLNAYSRGYLNGTIYAGMILSAFFWGFLSDKFGRQKTMVFGYLGDFVFGVATSLAPGFWTLLVFKFLSGFMICGPFSILTSYLSELFSAKRRDSIVMMVGFFQSIGSIFHPLIAWAIIPRSFKWVLWDGRLVINSWRLFLLVSSLPSLVSGIGALTFFESPRFLLAKGRKDEALNVFRSIYSINTGRPKNTYSVRVLQSEPTVNKDNAKQSVWQELTALFRPPHLYKALLVFSIQFGCLLTLNTIRLWLPQLLFFVKQSEGNPNLTTCGILSGNTTKSRYTNCDDFVVDTSVYTDMVYVNILTTVCFGVSILTVPHVGKRNLIVSLFVLQSLVICYLGWVRPPLTIALAAMFTSLSNTAGISLLGFVVQIFPTSLRTMAVSLTMMFGRIGVVIGNAVLPFFLSLSCHGTFIGFSLIALFCGLVVLALAAAASPRKTTNKS